MTYNDADDGTGNPAVVTDTADILDFVDIFNADFNDAAGNPDLDGFTIDNTGATVAGLWDLSTGRGADAGHTTDDSFYFGTGEGAGGGGNYDVVNDIGDNTAGRITSPMISLAGATAAELTFNYFLQTEDFAGFDNAVEADLALC